MSYKIWKSNSLTKLNDIKYDIIIRTRTDVSLDKELNIEINDYFNLPAGITVIKGLTDNWGFTDVLSYSNPNIMDYYSSFLFFYLKYINQGYFVWSNEYLFRIHLNHKNIKIREFFSYINVHREDKTEIINNFISNKNDIITELKYENLIKEKKIYCYLNNIKIYEKQKFKP